MKNANRKGELPRRRLIAADSGSVATQRVSVGDYRWNRSSGGRFAGTARRIAKAVHAARHSMLMNSSNDHFQRRRPPATATTWTRNDFEDLDAADPDMSLHPPHADLEDGVFIEDAHATIFAVQPSTHGHFESGGNPLYIAPNATMRGFVDYCVRVHNGSSSDNTIISWSLTEHEIEEVRLKKDGETIAERDGAHTPALDYYNQIEDDWSANLTLEAEISVRLKQTIRTDLGDRTDHNVTHRTDYGISPFNALAKHPRQVVTYPVYRYTVSEFTPRQLTTTRSKWRGELLQIERLGRGS